MKNLLKAIFILATIVSFILLFFSPDTSKQDQMDAEIILKEYPQLEDYLIYGERSIKGVVLKAKLGDRNYIQGAVYIELTNGEKFSIGTNTRNYQYEPEGLIHFLQVNDSISKPANDNLFLIYRNGERYFFKLRQDINRKKE
ncbi:MAG: hypothetical protein LBU84_07900 [Prevotella sp.]|jgi:hypothetical protein|nr:hypothetical protein [Prevotella sp.]